MGKERVRTGRAAIDCSLADLHRKKETEWMLKLRTAYSYGLNDRVEHKDQAKNAKI